MSAARRLYAETIPATFLRLALAGSAGVVFAVAALIPADPFVRVLIASAGGTELLMLWLLHDLTIEVTAEALELRFGPGWIRRRHRIADLASAERIEGGWRTGAGVRFGVCCTTYRVAAGELVELRLRSGWRLRIGVPDAAKFLRALAEAGIGPPEPKAA